MSEVSKCNIRVQQLGIEVEQFRNVLIEEKQSYSDGIEKLELVNHNIEKLVLMKDKISNEIKDLGMNLKKIFDKIDIVDPITGTCRYGPSTLAKIHAQEESFESSKLTYDGVIEEAEQIIIHYNNKKESLNLQKKQLEEQSIELSSTNEGQHHVTEDNESDKLALKQSQEEQVLAARAELARERRRATIQARKESLEEMRRLFQERVDRLNSSPTGPIALEATLREMEAEAKDTKAIFQIAKTVLLTILTNINNHPDNTSFRTLRLNNTKLREELIGEDVCGGMGLSAVLACGFRASIEWFNLDIDAVVGDMESLEVGEVLLVMTEPDPEAADGTARWIAWFDDISACKDLLLAAM